MTRQYSIGDEYKGTTIINIEDRESPNPENFDMCGVKLANGEYIVVIERIKK